MKHGKLVISLDLELFWGVRDKLSLSQYGANVKAVHSALPRMTAMFAEYGIHATFATVGFLFCETKEELFANLPQIKPKYKNAHLSPYDEHLQTIGKDVRDDPYHFAGQLVQTILATPSQEVGSHTFSHFYCLEAGQSVNEFSYDLLAAKNIAEKKGITLTSIVFPRNQFNEKYLKACAEAGIICFRGNEQSWLYKAIDDKSETLIRRALRLTDAFVNISGHHCHGDAYMLQTFPVNIAASRFLRPFHPKLKFLESLKLNRIKSSMLHAAKNKLTYHLWWHPHNFGADQDQNFEFLEKILKYYRLLSKQYDFRSYTMTELANQLLKSNAERIKHNTQEAGSI